MSEDEPKALLERDGPVATLLLNRPSVLNAVDVGMAEAIRDAVRTLRGDGDVRVLVVRGRGRAFMAGGDIGAFQGEAAGRNIDAIIRPFHEAVDLLQSLPLPVLAVLHGAVAGAGFSFAMACDLAIAADDTRFTMAYSRLGTSIDGGSSFGLPRLVGLRKALELALLSDTIDAAEAHRLGLVNKVVPAAALDAEAESLARRLAEAPTVALGRIKALLRASSAATLAEQLEAERLAFLACSETADFKEGVAAFLGKRKPVFDGK